MSEKAKVYMNFFIRLFVFVSLLFIIDRYVSKDQRLTVLHVSFAIAVLVFIGLRINRFCRRRMSDHVKVGCQLFSQGRENKAIEYLRIAWKWEKTAEIGLLFVQMLLYQEAWKQFEMMIPKLRRRVRTVEAKFFLLQLVFVACVIQENWSEAAKAYKEAKATKRAPVELMLPVGDLDFLDQLSVKWDKHWMINSGKIKRNLQMFNVIV